MFPRPGEVYWAFVGPKRRPVMIVSREELNRGTYVVAVLVASAGLDVRWNLPNCTAFEAGQFGLEKDCVAQAETITQVERSELDLATGVIGTLDPAALRNLIRSIGYVISAECEPS